MQNIGQYISSIGTGSLEPVTLHLIEVRLIVFLPQQSINTAKKRSGNKQKAKMAPEIAKKHTIYMRA